ncbi:MAG: hypothetical protein QM656_17845 [Paracoccaceae bacterium]
MPVSHFALMLGSVIALGGATVAVLSGSGSAALAPIAALAATARLARWK